ncbi:hypothetical protein B0H16DRAFT_1257065, partial [Mycena metata]
PAVLTLPPEITSEIFLQCVPIKRERNTKEAPLLFTQICRDWRHIAVSTSALWTTFDVAESTTGLVHFPEIVETWLARARGRPLTVKIRGAFAQCQRIFQTLYQHASTMQVLELRMNPEAFEAMETHPWDCPILRGLYVSFIPVEYRPVRPLNILRDAPLLQEVVVACALHSSFALPWRRLTRFTGAFRSCADYLGALRLMPNLTYCAAALAFPGSESPLLLPRLQHLVLFNTRSLGANPLEFLTLPALQNLEI